MKGKGFRRREVVVGGLAAATALATGLPGPALAQGQASARRSTRIGWLDGEPPLAHDGVTWGVPWPRGTLRGSAPLTIRDGDGRAVPLQSWVTAWWPDRSVKWTAHAVPAGTGLTSRLEIEQGRPAASQAPVSVRESASVIEVATGPIRWRVARSGETIIESALNDGRETVRDVKLMATTQDRPDSEEAGSLTVQEFTSEIGSATVEQSGPVRAVVRVEGRHSGGGRGWLPFTVRLYFYAGSEAVRIVHSFTFDGDASQDFIRGLGLTGTVPMSDATHDRHVRFAGEGDGLWGEAVRPLTGLRRDPGPAAREAQVAGRRTPPTAEWRPGVADLLGYVPEWGDFTLSQPNSDGFSIAKRTAAGQGWIEVDAAHRAAGFGYVGGASGGAAFGMGDFWQRCPVRLDVRNAHTEAARFTLWYYSPDGPPMDLRPYHDGMGMTGYVEQNKGLDITYEDYEPGWDTPYGIARTTEFTLWALPETPSRQRLAAMASTVSKPPRPVPTPEDIHAADVFGDWSLPDRTMPARRAIEEQNDYLLNFYLGQIEQRRWYGFWHYGDVMHTYDRDRHVWRYDIGGYAWDNSELSTDLWLWYSFLRSGRADVFRMAEAMTRHTGEVDVYHLGPMRGLGTRHGVQHWSDSSKQVRVSNAAFRRIYYFLTADERTGDLMRELVDSDQALARVEISRKVGAREGPGAAIAVGAILPSAPPPPGHIFMEFGIMWSSVIAAWLAEWERTGDTRWRDRILAGMNSIAALPKQWFAGGANYDLATGRFSGPVSGVRVSHLSVVFGAVETHSELFTLLDAPAYKEAWIDYCATYNAPAAEFEAMTGAAPPDRNLQQGNSRLTAYAANERHDPALAKRAWTEFYRGIAGLPMGVAAENRRIAGPDVLKPVDEAPRVSTNSAAQWGLAAIQNLALIGDALPEGPAERI